MHKQQGIAVIAVLVFLLVIAAVATLKTGEEVGEINLAVIDTELRQLDYVTQAGIQHAVWQAERSTCSGDFTIPDHSLAADTYGATATGFGVTASYVLAVDQDAWIRSDDSGKNNGTAIDQHIRFEDGDVEQALIRFGLSSLPAGARINSASVWFYIESGKEHPEGAITAHRVLADWTETGATWDSMNGNFDNAPLAMIPAQANSDVWVQINLTAQVQAWVNGDPNYGIMLGSVAEDIHAEYVSREGPSNQRPRLEVVVGSGPVTPLTIQATGTTSNGTARYLNRSDAQTYQAPSGLEITSATGVGQDTMIKQDMPAFNYGGHAEMWVQDPGGGTGDQSLLEFDLAGVPPGARISNAKLELWQHDAGTPGGTVAVHRLTRDWDAGTGSGSFGDGANWYVYDWFKFWATPGGDFDGKLSASTDIPAGNVGWQEWDITALVDDWVRGKYSNQGLILTSAAPGTDVGFSTSDDSDITVHPKLTVTFACECGTVCMSPQGSGKVLLVVGTSVSNLGPGDQSLQDLLQGWGYMVNLIKDDDSQGDFDTALLNNDVVFVSESVATGNVGAKVVNTGIGVINAEGDLNDELGVSAGSGSTIGTTADVVDTTHFITQIFPAGPVVVKSAASAMQVVSGSVAPGAQELARVGGAGAVVAVDSGAALIGGGTAAGRRVLMSVGDSDFELFLSNDGQLLLHRALQWGIGATGMTPTDNLLLVVVDPDSLTVQETAKKNLIEGWGYTVNLIDEQDSQANFDTAVAANDVVFITEDVLATSIGTKLVAAPIGVVTEEANLSDEFGMSDGIAWETGTDIEINDNSHYITTPFSLGLLTVLTTTESLAYVTPPLSPDLSRLAGFASGFGVIALDIGAATVGGGTATGRRAQLPWGGNDMDVNNLNADGLTIFERALEWGAGASVPDPIILSTGSNATLGGLSFADEDLARYIPANDTATLYLDGSAIGQTIDIDALHVLQNGHLVLSTTNAATLGGLGFADGDLVDYDPATDTATLYFAESAFSADEDIVSVYIMNNGNILLSTATDATLGGLDFQDTDLVEYDPAGDTATLYLDGSTTTLTIDIAAVHVLDNGRIVLATNADASLGGLNFKDGDLVEYDPATDTATLYFNENLFAGNEAINSVHIGAGSGAIGAGGGGGSDTLPIARWKLDETVGTIAVDSVGGHDGSLINGPSWAAGQLNGALDLDGSGDYISVPHEDTLSLTQTMTFTAWINPDVIGSVYNTVLAKDDGGLGSNYWFGLWQNELAFGFFAAGTFQEVFTSGLNVQAGNWQHIAASFDNNSNELLFYLDGTLVHSASLSFSPTAVTADLTIGRSPEGEYWRGLLDDVRIYDSVLPEAVIKTLASAGAGDGGSCDGTYRDAFDGRRFSGNDGSLTWAGDWLEVGEGNGATSGDIQVRNDQSDYQLRTRDNDNGGEGVEREADLSGATAASLSYDFRRRSLDNASDYTAVEVSANGAAGPWTELVRHQGPDNDGSYVAVIHDISAYVAANTRIRFKTSSGMGPTDTVWFDNIQIECVP